MRTWGWVLLVACGGDHATMPVDASHPDAFVPDAITPDAAPMGPGSALSHTLFINAEGVTIEMGSADDATTNTTTLISVPTATVGKYLAGDAQRTTKITDLETRTIGGANTPVSSQLGCGVNGEPTMDENARFFAAYGPR